MPKPSHKSIEDLIDEVINGTLRDWSFSNAHEKQEWLKKMRKRFADAAAKKKRPRKKTP